MHPLPRPPARPPSPQLNVVLVVSLVWTTFLSLAFPPAKVGADEPEKKKAD
jgi:hypothetical protein